MFWIWVAIGWIICGITGRIITRHLHAKIFMPEEEDEKWNGCEDVLAVISGLIYLALVGIFALLEKLVE
ncbi:MAG: hypothetical protein HQ579_04670 [Candidatus Omnitrophica bacterium]|nr:hypothetical protein [Candidatus Omnitrophota bacterium]